jgi:hypothetical protein
MSIVIFVSIAIVILVLLKCFSIRNRVKFWDSLKVGDWVVGSGVGGYHIDEFVVEKTGDSIRLSKSGWMSKGSFLYYGELDYFSRTDWYFW